MKNYNYFIELELFNNEIIIIFNKKGNGNMNIKLRQIHVICMNHLRKVDNLLRLFFAK